MTTDYILFSDALDPDNEDYWYPVLDAQSYSHKKDIYRVTIPGKAVTVFRGTCTQEDTTACSYIGLEPLDNHLPRLSVPIDIVEQYCPTPDLPTDTLSQIYDAVTASGDKGVRREFSIMILDKDGFWIGVDKNSGKSFGVFPWNIQYFALEPSKS